MKKLLIILSAIIFFIGCSSTTEDTQVKMPSITKIKGSVLILRNGNPLRAKLGYGLEIGDKIQTRVASFVDIDLGERGVIRIKPNSSFKLKKFTSQTVVSRLEKGQMLSSLRKLKKSEKFSISTPTMIAGIRGTSFMISSGESSKISVLTGKVAVTKDNKTVYLNEMKEIVVNETIQEEKFIRGTSLMNIKDMLNIDNVEKSGEVKQMKINLAKLELIDKKSLDDKIEINTTLKAKNINAKEKTTVENVNEKNENFGIKKKSVGSDDDMMLGK